MADFPSGKLNIKQLCRFAVIPVLSLVALALLFWPDGRDAATTASAPTAADTDSETGAGETSAPARNRSLPRKMPYVPLADILEYDPFSLPTSLQKELDLAAEESREQALMAERERIGQIVQSLQQQRLNVVFEDEGRVSAILGTRVVHEGDEIAAGIRIQRITPQGLTLEVVGELAPATEVVID